MPDNVLDLRTVSDDGDLIQRVGPSLRGLSIAELAQDPAFAAALSAVTSVNGLAGAVLLLASHIPITDSGENFSSSDVEGALAELADAIGSGGGVEELDDLSDVVITSPATGAILRFNGTNWIDDAQGGVDTSGTPAATNYARFTDANTIEGRTASQVRSDLDLSTHYAPALVTINTQTGTSYTAQQSDNGKLIQVNNGSAHTLTLPSLSEGTVITIHCKGAGGVTFATSGTTFDGSSPKVACAQNEGMQAIYTSSTTIAVIGGTA